MSLLCLLFFVSQCFPDKDAFTSKHVNRWEASYPCGRETRLILLFLAMCAYRNSQSRLGKQSPGRMSMQMKAIASGSPLLCCASVRYCEESAAGESPGGIQAWELRTSWPLLKYNLISEGRAQHKMTWGVRLSCGDDSLHFHVFARY